MRGGGGGGLADGGPPSASSSSSSTMLSQQEVNLLIPGGSQVSWWPRQGWEAWVQHGNDQPSRELDAKLDVTPESNGTSISEVANERNEIFMNERKWLNFDGSTKCTSTMQKKKSVN